MGLGSQQSNAGQIAEGKERQRQALIKSGLSQIQGVFGGGTYGTGPTQYKKGSPMFTGAGKDISKLDLTDPDLLAFAKAHNLRTDTRNTTQQALDTGLIASGTNPFQGIFSKSSGHDAFTLNHIRDFYERWLGKTGALYSGTASSPGFDDTFYQGRAKDFENFALPQLASQANDQGKSLTYELANRGLSKSTAGSQLGGSLLKEINKQRAGIVSSGQSQAQDLQKQVEGSRSNLISQLEASADPASAGAQALSTAASFRAPSQFAPLTGLFQNWANTFLANRATNPTSANSLMSSFAPFFQNAGRGGASFIPGNTTIL